MYEKIIFILGFLVAISRHFFDVVEGDPAAKKHKRIQWFFAILNGIGLISILALNYTDIVKTLDLIFLDITGFFVGAIISLMILGINMLLKISNSLN